jgi:hypothetical protein
MWWAAGVFGHLASHTGTGMVRRMGGDPWRKSLGRFINDSTRRAEPEKSVLETLASSIHGVIEVVIGAKR